MSQTVWPYLFYADVDAASEFLQRAFGFREIDRQIGAAGRTHLELEAEFVKRPRSQWLAILEANDVPSAAVLSFEEVFQDPQALHLQLALETDHPTQGRWRIARPKTRPM